MEKELKEEISVMKSSLKLEGWAEHEALPEHWLYKTSRDGTAFIDSDGDLFRNKDQALRHLQENGKKEFLEAYELLKAFDSSSSKLPLNGKKTFIHDEWIEFDSGPLNGWKYKDNGGHSRYLSPSGDYLNSKNHAMKFLMKNDYSKDAISAMRSTFIRVQGK